MIDSTIKNIRDWLQKSFQELVWGNVSQYILTLYWNWNILRNLSIFLQIMRFGPANTFILTIRVSGLSHFYEVCFVIKNKIDLYICDSLSEPNLVYSQIIWNTFCMLENIFIISKDGGYQKDFPEFRKSLSISKCHLVEQREDCETRDCHIIILFEKLLL